MTDATIAPEATTDLPENEQPAAVYFKITRPEHDTDRSLGWLIAAWMEFHLVHGDGAMANEPFELDDDARELVIDAYCLDEHGRRLYDRVVYCRGKGAAKSAVASATGLAEAMGPVRFAGFAKPGDKYEDRETGFVYYYELGEPMGRHIKTPKIDLVANDESQSLKMFDKNIYFNLDPKNAGVLARVPGVEANKTFAATPNGGIIRPVQSSGKSLDGLLQTYVIFEEAHDYTEARMHHVHEKVRGNLRKRLDAEPWSFYPTTIHQDGQGSVLELLYNDALEIEQGKKPNFGLYFNWISGGDIANLRALDTSRLEAVLRGAMSERDWVDYQALIAAAFDGTTSQTYFRRYHLNQVGNAEDAYFATSDVEAIVDDTIPALKAGDVIVLGYDQSEGHEASASEKAKRRIPDATALIACRISDMTLHPLGIWEAPESASKEPWAPPLDLIRRTWHDIFKKYKVAAVYADPNGGAKPLLREMTVQYGRQLKSKRRENPMHYSTSDDTKTFAHAVDEFYEDALRRNPDGTPAGVRIVDDLVLQQHLLNARRRGGRWGGTLLYKPNADSNRKVDAAVASVLAWKCATDLLADPRFSVATRRRSRGNLI